MTRGCIGASPIGNAGRQRYDGYDGNAGRNADWNGSLSSHHRRVRSSRKRGLHQIPALLVALQSAALLRIGAGGDEMILESIITCPNCRTAQPERMPADA